MVRPWLRVVLAMAVVLALLGVEPGGLRSEPELPTSAVTPPTAQNGATGVHADQGAHGSTVTAAARSIQQGMGRWRSLPTLIAVAAAVVLVLASMGPSRRLRPTDTGAPRSAYRSSPRSPRAPPSTV
jgi:hypothetical protein